MGLFSTGAVIGPGVGSFAHATSPLLAFSCLAGAAALTIPLVLRAPVGRHDRARAQLRALDRIGAAQPARAGRHHPLGHRSGVAGRDRPARAAPPALARRADLAHRRRAHDRRRVRRDLRARSPAAEPSASARCAWAQAPRSALVRHARAARHRPLRPAQLLLLVAVAPALHDPRHGHVPALDARRRRARRLARRRQRRPLGDLGDRLRGRSLATGVLADRHGDTATYAIVASVCASLLATLGDHRPRPPQPRPRPDEPGRGCSDYSRRARRARSRRPRR